MKTRIVIFTKGVKPEGKVVAILTGLFAIIFMIAGIFEMFKNSENFGEWIPYIAMACVAGLISWALARKKI